MEDAFNCPLDCSCGNGMCEPELDESCLSCPDDCASCQQGMLPFFQEPKRGP